MKMIQLCYCYIIALIKNNFGINKQKIMNKSLKLILK
jgi:hypothetical protein